MNSVIDTYSKENKIMFWAAAKCTNSLNRFAPGTKKYRLKAQLLFGEDRLIKVRHYKGTGGEIRKTIEVEV